MRTKLIAAFALAVVCMAFPAFVCAQAAPTAQNQTGSIVLYIRTEFGGRLTIPPQVTLIPESTGMPMPYVPLFTGDGGITFTRLTPGEDYRVIIRADGYRVGTETVSLPEVDGASVTDIIYLRPLAQKNAGSPSQGQYVLAPRAEKEVQHGLSDMRDQKFDSAQKHVEKALHMAPGNPYVNYVMGMVFLLSKQTTEAKPYLEKSVSIDPKQPPSLLALGTVRHDLGDFPGAIQVLEQDVQLDATSWQAEWILADSYIHEKNYAKAQEYAEKALQTGKTNAARVALLLGEAEANLGEREEAATTFENYLAANPTDPNAARIRGFVETLRRPPPPAAKPAEVPVAEHTGGPGSPAPELSSTSPGAPAGFSPSAPPVELPPKENWAPPDVDAAKPVLISGPACSLPKVLASAARQAKEFVDDLQKFYATEEFQSVEIKRDEQLEKPESSQYDYLVFIEEPKPGSFDVKESRNAKEGANVLPGRLADIGAPALALAFHPAFHDDFDWSCEGLAKWKGTTAWVVHFEQKKYHAMSLLASFSTPSRQYLLPLKGRAWIAEKGGQVVHLETDLVEPIPQIRLVREHYSIDYEPVSFASHDVTLWLPENVDVYYQYKGHYLHHFHHYSDFHLFWVGASEKIADPKQPKQ